LYWKTNKNPSFLLDKTREIIGSDPEIGNVYFYEIEAGLRDVYFGPVMFIVVLHSPINLHHTLHMSECMWQHMGC